MFFRDTGKFVNLEILEQSQMWEPNTIILKDIKGFFSQIVDIVDWNFFWNQTN